MIHGLLWLSQHPSDCKCLKGVFRFLDSVRDEDPSAYAPDGNLWGLMRKPRTKGFSRTVATYQMSDHCPMWVELRIDYSDPFIAVAGGLAPGRGIRAGEGKSLIGPEKPTT
jgi:hypothetical protein